MSATVAVLDYDKIAARIEATERRAGVPIGTWRWASAEAWNAAIRLGLRRAVALEERRERLAQS